MQSDLTAQSADITPDWIGNRRRGTQTRSNKTLIAIFRGGNKQYQMHIFIFTAYLFYEAADISKEFKEQGEATAESDG